MKGEQRTNNIACNGKHTTKSGDTRAAKEIHQHSFNVVICMMGRDHVPEFFIEQLIEPGVSQFPGGHLYRKIVRFRVGVSVDFLYVKRRVVLFGKATHQQLVFIAFLSPQLKIDVGEMKEIAGTMAKLAENNGINTATHRQQQPPGRLKKSIVPDMIDERG